MKRLGDAKKERRDDGGTADDEDDTLRKEITQVLLEEYLQDKKRVAMNEAGRACGNSQNSRPLSYAHRHVGVNTLHPRLLQTQELALMCERLLIRLHQVRGGPLRDISNVGGATLSLGKDAFAFFSYLDTHSRRSLLFHDELKVCFSFFFFSFFRSFSFSSFFFILLYGLSLIFSSLHFFTIHLSLHI